MLKNLPLKFIALILAAIFWVFVVSLENTFYKLPADVPIRVFNQAENLALASPLSTVRLTVRTADSLILRNLSLNDFEAYVDLRDSGAGRRRVQVSVTSKNPQVNVVRIEPSEVELELEPVREKIVSLAPRVHGKLKSGFQIESVKLLRETVTVSGAESLLKKITKGEAEVEVSGEERENFVKKGNVKIFGEEGILLEGLRIEPQTVDVIFTVVEVEGSKQVGVKAKITGSVANGTVKKVEVQPAVISVTGSSEALASLHFIETEEIKLENLPASGEKKVKVVLPEGVKLGDKKEVIVRIEVEAMK